MNHLSITAAYDGYATSAGVKNDVAGVSYVGTFIQMRRSFVRFSLAALPNDAVIDSASLYTYVLTSGVGSGISVWPYNGNGQTDPQPDSAVDAYARSLQQGVTEHGYVFSAPVGPCVVPLPWLSLIADAKKQVGRFAIGLTNPSAAAPFFLDSLEGSGNPPKLVLSYHSLLAPNEGGRLRHRAAITDAYNQVKAHVI